MVPDLETHHGPGFEPMPGMLTEEELAQLEQAERFEFDSLFLETHDQAPCWRRDHG